MPSTPGTTSRITDTILERYRAQPRAIKWAIWAAIAIILYFPLEKAFDVTRDLDAMADGRMRLIRTVGVDAPNYQNIVESGERVWGGVALPGTSMSKRSNEVQSRIASILANHGIRSNIQKAGENTIRLGADFQDRAEETVAKVLATSFKMQFDATPDVLSAVLADLEKQPEIARVSKVTLSRKVRGNLLSTTITVEAWSWTYEGMNEGSGG